ncbi:MAG: hypothetical protein ACFFAN_02660 [Promethearchaeota archaeon]
MVKKKTFIILIIFIVIAVIHGLYIEPSLNVFFSWLLIGFWILFTIRFFLQVRRARSFGSPHNTSFFILGPLIIGSFYSFWAYFTGFLGSNLFENLAPILYLSPWTLIFALPYLLYSLYSLNSCFKRYDVVYLFKTKSVDSRKFGTFLSSLILFFFICNLILFGLIIEYFSFILTPINIDFDLILIDLMFLILSIFSAYLITKYAIFGASRSLPEVTPEYIARRRSRIDSINTPTARPQPRRQPTSSTSRQRPRRQPTSSSSRQSPRRQPATSTSRQRPRGQPTTSTAKSASRRGKTSSASKPVPHRQKSTTTAKFEKLKPKAGILSLEDFKCIFCFNLPKLPEDEKRGIILCPKCRHPAHADEFKEWLARSNLCSRCSAPISIRFQRNPKIISVKEYLEVIKEFSKRKR